MDGFFFLEKVDDLAVLCEHDHLCKELRIPNWELRNCLDLEAAHTETEISRHFFLKTCSSICSFMNTGSIDYEVLFR